MHHIAEIESLDVRIAGRDALFQELAQELGLLRELAGAGQEIVSGIAALISHGHAAAKIADQAKPAVAPSPADGHVPNNHAPDALPDEAGEQNKG